MEEIENVLGIRAYPMNWPIGIDGHYVGVYNRKKAQIELFEDDNAHGSAITASKVGSVEDPVFRDMLGADVHKALCEDIELLDMAGDAFEMEKVEAGELTPMFFGSAMTNFGVRPFLEDFLRLAPQPISRVADTGKIDSSSEMFSAFVFKIQANMNPAHRDRLAFMRICSGKFTRGMEVYHKRTGKMVKLSQPQQFMAQERTIVEEAYPGDIIGVFDPGVFGIGDTLCQAGEDFAFRDFPIFPPELFARVQPKDTMKRKQFVKGMTELTQEGAVQVFRQPDSGVEAFIIGVVGSLQFEVLEYRLKNEYGVNIIMDRLPYSVARWLTGEKAVIKAMKGMDNGMLVEDIKDRPVALSAMNGH
jgi:peptide chain release factor 3